VSSVPARFFLAFGVVLGAFCAGRQGDAQEPKGTSSAPAKASSAAPAAAAHETPPNVPDQMPSHSVFGGRYPGSRGSSQPPTPSEPLGVLKSGPEHTRLVYHLKNSPAHNVATTITNLLGQEGQWSGSAATAAKSGTVLRVAISPETITNSIVVSGPPDGVEEVRKLVEKLDQPQLQVQFEMEMGEVVAGEAKHGESLKSEGGSPANEKANTFYVLERPKTMKTIARARVLALDNQAANIQLGQRVPSIANFPQYGAFGKNSSSGPMPTVTHMNVGLLLGVTARINVKEGTVVLMVDAEDSRLGPESEGIPLSVADGKVIRSPRIESMVVQTTVAIPDGKTIMLGSIGRMGKDDKELVIVLTPHIVRPDAEKTGP
jgi:Flp pilus assembly secretin CpaC